MATVVPISTILTYAKISQYLAEIDAKRQNSYKGGSNIDRLPRMLYMERKAVQWKYSVSPSDYSLEATGNYLYALCGKYIAVAKQIIGMSGGQIIINPQTGLPINFGPRKIQFVVSPSSPYMIPGQSSFLIPDTALLAESLRISIDGIEIGYGLSDRISYTTSTGATGTVVIFNTPMENNQLVIMEYIYSIANGNAPLPPVFTGLTSLKFIIGNSGGSGIFDGYKPAGNILQDNRLINVKIASIVVDGLSLQDYLSNGNQIGYNSTTGSTDFTNVGGLNNGSWIEYIIEK